ncbi:MAG: thiol-activated cytolysin family protein [Myxococcota bacterium]
MKNETKTKTRIRISLAACAVALGGCAGGNEDPFGGPFGGPPPAAADDDDEPLPEPPADDETGDESGESGEESEFDPDAIDAFVASLGHVEIPAASPLQEVACGQGGGFCPDPWQEGDLTCTYAEFTETAHAKSITALQPESVWPGAIIVASAAYAGDIVPIVTERAEGTVSISLDSIQGSPVGVMEEPTLASFRDTLHDVLATGVSGGTAAAISHQVVTVASSSQLELQVGAGIQWEGGAQIGGMFDFDDASFDNRFLLDFTQVYFSVDFEPPSRPADLFGDSVTVDVLADHSDVGDPPLYISSVKYGRRVLFAIETNRSLQEMSAAIGAALNANAAVEIGVEALDTLAASKISALVVGGSGDNAVKTVKGPAGLVDYLLEGGDFSADSPGLPIAYSMAHLDNTPAKHAFTAEFKKKVCQPS